MKIVTTVYTFDTPADYIYNAAQIDVSGGSASLLLADYTGLEYIQAYDNDTGFTYTASEVEFVNGVATTRDQRPANALFHSNFTTKDGNWGNGSLTGTLVGSAVITAGELETNGANNSYIQYDGANNSPSGNKGCVRFNFTPDYSGSPGINAYLFAMAKGESDIDNLIRLCQINTTIRIDIWDDNGSSVLVSQTGNNFNPTADQTYEFEFNWDADAGQHRLFIDGVLVGGTKSGTGTLGVRNIIRMSKDYTASTNASVDGTFDNLIIFDTPQHTANYTPGATIPATIYAESVVTLPVFTYSGLGTTQSFDSVSVIDANSPRYILNGMYWNGSAWAASSDTYATANDFPTINTNLAALTVSDSLTVKAVFQASNTNSDINVFTMEYTGQQYNLLNPTIKPSAALTCDRVLSITEDVTVVGSDAIKYTAEIDGVVHYHNGTHWVASSGYSESNTLAEVNSNVDTLIQYNSTFKLVAHLHSDDGSTNPTLNTLTVNTAASGTTDFNQTKEQIIRDALILCGGLEDDETPTAEQESFACRALNRMVKAWSAKGLKTWCWNEYTLVLTKAKISYTLGPSTGADLKIERPLELRNVRKIITGTEETPVRVISRAEYMDQPSKNSESEPVAVFYDAQLDNGLLYVWPAPDNAHTLKFSAKQYIEDFDVSSDNPYFPQEWIEALIYNLAVRLCPKYEVKGPELNILMKQAAQFLSDAENCDLETGSLYLGPEVYY